MYMGLEGNLQSNEQGDHVREGEIEIGREGGRMGEGERKGKEEGRKEKLMYTCTCTWD